MSMPTVKAEDLKIVLRGLLISCPHDVTVHQLERDFVNQEGRNVPFRELGYSTFMKYLESIPDTVFIRRSLSGGCPIAVPVQSNKSAHIDTMVQKQKTHPPKRSSQTKHPAQRISIKATPQMSSDCYRTNYKSSNMQKGLFVPASLQERIYKIVHDNPQGVLVQTIEQEFLSCKVLQNYGIPEGFDIHNLLSHLDHSVRISDGMVYPLHNRPPPYRPIIQKPVTDNTASDIPNSQAFRFTPAEHEGGIGIFKQSCTVDVVNRFSAERKDDDVGIAEALQKQAKISEIVEDSDVCTTRSLTCDTEDLNVSPESGALSDDTDMYDSASGLVGEKMRMNFQTLLEKHPNGIWCSELPDLYKKEFEVVLEYTNFGYVSVMHMVSNLPDVFHCVKVDEAEWKLFDARKKLPAQYAKHNAKNNNPVLTSMVPTVPTKVALNIQTLLQLYPAGIMSDKIPNLYREQFLTTLKVSDLGFASLEAFLLALHTHVLHMRYVSNKIIVLPAGQGEEPQKANPFPHLESQHHSVDLYPPEAIGPKGTIKYEKIPPEAIPGGYLEVIVAEIITPLKFWVQLRGENTHLALDRLMDEMQRFYQQEAGNYNMPDRTVRIGQYCVAPYNKEWHRACVTAVHNLVDVQVLFIDYGTKCRLKKSELRFMHADYAQFPIQAIKASLANLVPVGGGITWPHEASVHLLHLVQSKGLIAIVSSVDHEACKLEVALVDTTGDEDIHINDVLVNRGFAEYKSKRPASTLPLQPKRIDGDPMSSMVTASRPPPDFASVSELHEQPVISPTCSSPPGQSMYVPEMPDVSHPQTSLPIVPILPKSTYVPGSGSQGQAHVLPPLPNFPLDHSIQSNFVSQPNSVAIPPVMYDAPLLAGASSLAAQSSVIHQLVWYENFLYQQKLRGYLSLLFPHNIGAAALVNPFVVPELYPRMVRLPEGIVKSSPERCAADVLCDEQPTAEAIVSPKKVKSVGQVMYEQQQNKNELVHKPVNNTALREFSSGCYQSDNMPVAESRGVESESQDGFESQCVHDGREPDTDLSSSSDDIYRSGDESDEEVEGACVEQMRPTLRKSSYVKQIEIAGKVIHLIKIMGRLYLCTEEVVKHFTDFSGRFVILKLLDSKNIIIPFCEIGRKEAHAIIADLESYDVMGVPKTPDGSIIGKVHLTPLVCVTELFPFISEQYQQEFRSVMASVTW